jgi:hypothetical protein
MKAALEPTVASTFDALAWEIELAGARCIYLDSIIGKLLPTVPPEQREHLTEGMQAVDLLSQHLTGLSTFARRMSQSVATDIAAPVEIALAEITLGALADRLSTALGGEEKGVNDGDEAGDPDLF